MTLAKVVSLQQRMMNSICLGSGDVFVVVMCASADQEGITIVSQCPKVDKIGRGCSCPASVSATTAVDYCKNREEKKRN